MKFRNIPTYFFLNGQLHKYIKTVRSSNDVVAWNYPEEERLWLPRNLVRKEFRRAFTLTDAARTMRIPKSTIYELIDNKLIKPPDRSYDLSNFRPLRGYFNEDFLYDIRNAAWDELPKNRFGEPRNDTMTSEDELRKILTLSDDREFYIDDDGEFQRVYQA